jgi:hypothetical protein
LTQAGTITNTCTSGNGFNVGNFTDKLEVHRRPSCQVFISDSREPLNY